MHLIAFPFLFVSYFVGNRPRLIREKKDKILHLKRQKVGTARAYGGTAVPSTKQTTYKMPEGWHDPC